MYYSNVSWNEYVCFHAASNGKLEMLKLVLHGIQEPVMRLHQWKIFFLEEWMYLGQKRDKCLKRTLSCD